MGSLGAMPPLSVDRSELSRFGRRWEMNGGSLSRTPPQSSGQLGALFDSAVGGALAEMLGGIPVAVPSSTSLLPAAPDSVGSGQSGSSEVYGRRTSMSVTGRTASVSLSTARR